MRVNLSITMDVNISISYIHKHRHEQQIKHKHKWKHKYHILHCSLSLAGSVLTRDADLSSACCKTCCKLLQSIVASCCEEIRKSLRGPHVRGTHECKYEPNETRSTNTNIEQVNIDMSTNTNMGEYVYICTTIESP